MSVAVSNGKKEVRFTNKPISQKTKPGGRKVVSRALVKEGATNLVPKIHVKRGDTVMLIAGPKKNDPKRSADIKKRMDARNIYKGQIGKVISVFPKSGKIIVEGINLVTRATKARSMTAKAGLVRKEAPIFACKVMLYDTEAKKPVRASAAKRKALGL